jgi:hypothetical protein
MLVLKTKQSRYGAFQKMRLVSLDPQPDSSPLRCSQEITRPVSATAADRLGFDLVTAMTINRRGLTLSPFGKSFNFIPAMLEASPVLSAATAYCLDARERRLSPTGQTITVDPVLYGNAISSLQAALEDPVQRVSKTTLMATVVMHRVEVSKAKQSNAIDNLPSPLPHISIHG